MGLLFSSIPSAPLSLSLCLFLPHLSFLACYVFLLQFFFCLEEQKKKKKEKAKINLFLCKQIKPRGGNDTGEKVGATKQLAKVPAAEFLQG